MNKMLIPAILAATVLLAGTFALMPVQKASTIHTSLTGGAQENADDQERVLTFTIFANWGNTAHANN